MASRMLLLGVMFVAAAAFIARASKPEIVPVRETLSRFPMRIGAWQGQEAPEFDPRVLAVLGVDDYVNRIYYGPERSVAGLYIGYYESQREGDTIHSPLNCLPGAGWNPTKRDHISIPVALAGSHADSSVTIQVNRILIVKYMEKNLVLYWYQSHGRVTPSEYWGKIYTVLDALRTNRTDAALIRVICPVAGLEPKNEAIAEERAVDFVKSLFPFLSHFLPE